ncbi:MAG TPA: NlpC/P60 family protein [Pseudonocardiaceae bacterium]
MASNRLKRTMRGVLAATALVAVIGVTPSLADPAPPSSSTPPPPTMPTGTPEQVYQQLAQQASDVNNKLEDAQAAQQQAQTTLNNANADLTKAQQALQAAENTEAGLQGQVDQLTDAQYEGARFGQLSALLTGSSAKDYLDKATLLQDMAEDSSKTLDGMQAATDAATAAQQRATKDQQTAQDATNKANSLVSTIQQQKDALTPLVAKAQAALTHVSKSAQNAANSSLDPGSFIAPAGAAGVAIQAAEGEIGVPYSWGGASPSGFDCSGLMLWAWAKAGISLPHSSSAQSTMGVYVPLSQLQPGDLIFFGSPIHHVGMYVGNGDMIDAPDTGSTVKIQPIFSGARFGRRLAG